MLFRAAMPLLYAWQKMNELIPYMWRQGQEIQSHAALGA